MNPNPRLLRYFQSSLITAFSFTVLLACNARDPDNITSGTGALDAPATENRPIHPPPANYQANTIGEKLVNSGSFQTLTAAAQSTGLIKDLTGNVQYTVFAPTDQAFSQLPKEALQRLMQPENKTALEQLIAYHVVPRTITTANTRSRTISTLTGEPITLQADRQSLKVNGVGINQPAIQANNGAIYPIDQVLLPPGFSESWNLKQQS